jgi:predicted O-linked N-acetylglucosamine transferase (SPINDLY family)
VAHHQAGRLDEAAALYAEIRKQAPGHFDATHLSGVIALQRGDLARARELITQALAVKPKDAPALNNLGTALLRAGQLDAAREQFERAVRAQPAFGDALSNLGNVLRQLGRVADSVAPLKKAFAAAPRSTMVANLLGASLLDIGDARGATNVFEAVVKLSPRDAQAWTHLSISHLGGGSALRALAAADEALRLAPEDGAATGARAQALAGLGRADAAREAFLCAVRLAPRDARAWNNLGVFLRAQGEPAEAAERFRKAIEIDPAFAIAHEGYVAALIDAGRAVEAAAHAQALSQREPEGALALASLGAARFAQDRLDEALALYERAAASRGATAGTLVGHGNVLWASGDSVAAARQFARAVELDPRDPTARFALAMAQLRTVYDDAAQMETSRRGLARAIADLDAWFTPDRAPVGAAAVGSAQPFYLAYHSHDNRQLLASYGQLVTRLMAAGGTAPPAAPLTARGPGSSPRIRVGIVSAQIRDHSVWNAITRGWVRHLDPERFELHLFHLERTADDETANARRLAASFIDAPTSLAGWTKAIADARPDVLIYPEIGMHPLTTRLAALRLAPIQATTWGHPSTSGLPTLDLFFSADALEPADADAHYTERLIRLPKLGVFVEPLAPVAVAPDLRALGLPESEPLLLCPGTPFKYTPPGDEALVAIARGLQERGAGRLVFFRSRRPLMSSRVEQRLRRAFKAAGVDHDRTVAWIPALDRGRFFGLMQRATLMLDTIGFSGFNTALQALECDLPVIAFEGPFMRGRLASGPLREIGLDEWVATTTADFADKALRLAGDDALRARVRSLVAERRGRLFNDLAPVRGLERALVDAVEGYRGSGSRA